MRVTGTGSVELVARGWQLVYPMEVQRKFTSVSLERCSDLDPTWRLLESLDKYTLTSVQIRSCSFRFPVELARFLRSCVHLVCVEISGCKLKAERGWLKVLLKSKGAMFDSLERLNLASNQLTLPLVTSLAAMISSKGVHLAHLNLSKCQLTGTELDALSPSLGNVQSLDLSHNNLSDGSLGILMSFPALKTLNVEACALFQTQQLQRVSPRLTHLNISRNDLGDAFFLSGALRENSLVTLEAHHTGMTSASFPVLMGDLRHINELDLSANDLGDELDSLVPHFRTLESLKLMKCNIATEGGLVLARGLALPECRMRKLILPSNSLGGAIQVLSQSVNVSATLHLLNLKDQHLMPQGAFRLLRVADNYSLISLPGSPTKHKFLLRNKRGYKACLESTRAFLCLRYYVKSSDNTHSLFSMQMELVKEITRYLQSTAGTREWCR